MRLTTTTFAIGLGIVFGAALLYAMKKESPAANNATTPPNPNPKPPPLGTSPGAAGPPQVFLPRYGGAAAAYNPNPLFQYYPQGK
jgi:hypothetical protein